MKQWGFPIQPIPNRVIVVFMTQYWRRLWEFGVALDFTKSNIVMLRINLGPFALGLDYCWRDAVADQP